MGSFLPHLTFGFRVLNANLVGFRFSGYGQTNPYAPPDNSTYNNSGNQGGYGGGYGGSSSAQQGGLRTFSLLVRSQQLGSF